MATRQGVDFDFCPACRGVWLEVGELEKLTVDAPQPVAAAVGDDHHRTQHPLGDEGRAGGAGRPATRLSDLLDFG
jgi:Zn-finger nucleic acid-binding protein